MARIIEQVVMCVDRLDTIESDLDAVNASLSLLQSNVGSGTNVTLDSILTAIQGLQATLTAMASTLTTINTKLAGGLPSVLNSDRLRVTGIL
jgi:RecG-like helicase